MSEAVVVVGAGAAGLMAAITAAQARKARSVVLVDGARSLGAKILVSGGGRCNVTHERVSEHDYAGSTPAAIKRVLRRFGVEQTVRFFAARGVVLKREETGKLFPVSDRARTVLDALLAAASAAGVRLRFPFRVEELARSDGGFVLRGPQGELRAQRVVLATGGCSLPKSGSDGHGYEMVRALGHTVTPLWPALAPLVLEPSSVLRTLSGLATDVRLSVRASTGKRLQTVHGPLLCTHFGVSGPAALDVSRHWTGARRGDAGAWLEANFWHGPEDELDERLRTAGATGPARVLQERLPERLARALCDSVGVDGSAPAHRLTREARRALLTAASAMAVPVTGDRGWSYAEVTAGGVPLAELRIDTLESRVVPGLFLCGEICDVDGRLGGFNFQWAWASGFVAGSSSVADTSDA